MDLLTQRAVRQIIGQSRLKRLLRAKWLAPAGRNGKAVLFDPADIRAALAKLELERERCPVDKIEVGRVRDSEARHNRSFVKKDRTTRPDLNSIELDFSAVKL